VVEALCRLLSEADIFTSYHDPSRVSTTIRSHRVTASFLDPLLRNPGDAEFRPASQNGLINRQAYGFRNFENYRLRVKVLCGFWLGIAALPVFGVEPNN
jgi:hypothetical protein